MNFSCPFCGGSRLEHLRNCPKIYTLTKKKEFNQKAKKDYFGQSPNIFVGRYGYPNVNVGLLSNDYLEADVDNPIHWAKSKYEIPKIVDLRSSLINSSFKTSVKSFEDKYVELSKEVSMSKKPVDVEINLNKRPTFDIKLDTDATPYGPSVKLEKARITQNPNIPGHVDKVASDTNLKASEGISYLYSKGYDEHYLTKIISAGNLGLGKKRKIVPTRWSITAVDDTLGKEIISEIKDYNEFGYSAQFGGYLGNYYLLLYFPHSWSYELFETYVGNPEQYNPEIVETATDFENYYGRKNYASNTAGGYYATRFSILEYLKEKKRQSSVLALRFITDEYYMSLGVWVVRNAVRDAAMKKPINFSSKELMLKYAEIIIKKKFGFNLGVLIKKSMLLKNLNTQKKIFDF